VANNNINLETSSNEKNLLNLKRPKGVWFIFIVSFWPLISMLSHIIVIIGIVPIEGPIKDYYNSLNFFDYFIILFLPLYIFTSALMLFRLKLIAVKLFFGYAILRVFLTIYNFSKPEFRELFMINISNSIVSHLISLFVIVFLLYYVNKLKNKGLLKL